MRILDATCGGRHMWFHKDRPDTIYVDRRILPYGSKPFRHNWRVKPDICADFTALPFAGGHFDFVVFDPPHIVRSIRGGKTSILRTCYGDLGSDFLKVVRNGFEECWRVLKSEGTLVFKWADSDVPAKTMLKLVGKVPLFKSKLWFIFVKTNGLRPT